jgi:uracil-DNA glycosylase
LKNIFKEWQSDLALPPPASGNLCKWAEQGVLLLNTVLTVEAGKAASHRNRGWEIFTDAVIRILAEQKQPLVFLLWGAFAQQKAAMIFRPEHLVIKAPHPSPLSAYTGFFGQKYFSRANAFLSGAGRGTIDWSL